MPPVLTDGEIASLLAEPKPLPPDYRVRVQTKLKRGHRERELDINGTSGGRYRLILRQSAINPLDFSAILAAFPNQSNTLFRLCRYNGKSHEHTNVLETQVFYDSIFIGPLSDISDPACARTLLRSRATVTRISMERCVA